MVFTRSHFVVASLFIALGGLAIYAATMLGEYIRDKNDVPTDIERSLSGDLLLEDGSVFDREQLRGKVVVVASWATWCPSCTQMLVDLARAKERFGRDIEVIAINRAEEASVVKDFRAAFPLPEGVTYVNDSKDTYFDGISGRSMPELIFYSKEGIVAERRIDAPTFDSLMTTLDTLTSN